MTDTGAAARSLEEVLGVLKAVGLMQQVTSLHVGEVHVTLREVPLPAPEEKPAAPRQRLSADEETEVRAIEKEEDRQARRKRAAHTALYGPPVTDA